MRYEKGHRARSREHILAVASRRFRQDGLNGTGLTAVMAEAGLTNGAFYGHFASREDLVRETVAHALDAQAADLASVDRAEGGFEVAVRAYLSVGHRDDPGGGCASAALVADVARQPQATRSTYTVRYAAIIDTVAALMRDDRDPGARAKAMAVFATMVGSLQLARAVSDDGLSDAILEAGVQGALTLNGG